MPFPCKQCTGSDLLALKTKRQSKANLFIFLVRSKKKRCFVNAINDLTLIKWRRIVAISEEGTKFQINLQTYLIQATKNGLGIWAMGIAQIALNPTFSVLMNMTIEGLHSLSNEHMLQIYNSYVSEKVKHCPHTQTTF